VEQRSQDFETGFPGHAGIPWNAYQTREAGTGILELRIKIRFHGSWSTETFPRTINVDPGTRFLKLLFPENENREDTGTGQGIFNQGSENRGVLRACSSL
jgi:hypothetical protein